ncbi:sensor histidine kinase [Halonatronum saccharophilum]|uniref:sensor histidine kinase n=1 Tax=Halonatronum saccharophilum TaxID=150060 RepID=UPI0004875CC5|nr:sensor histidine kinase [Halonatronum saccharophilum]
MKDKIKEILVGEIKQAILIGIGVTMFYFFTFYPYNGFNFKLLLNNLIFGSIVGYSIFVINNITPLLLNEYIYCYRNNLFLHIINSFFVSVVTYNLVVKVFSIFVSDFISGPYTFYISLGVGVISVMISVFYYALDKQEEALRLEKENKKLAVLEERNRIARELHDSVSQNLFGINLQLNTLEGFLDIDIKKSKEVIKLSKEMVEEVQTEMRLMIYELRPNNLEDKDFFVAVEDLINLYRGRYNLDIKPSLKGDEQLLSYKVKLALYRIIQESLNNVIKHAKATKVNINLIILRPESAKLMIKDNGQGFDIEQLKNKAGHLGLKGVEERVEEVTGKFEINSKLGEGTIIKVII